ncbi:MAG: GGDEF domain-containing protein [Chloroflexi bacterium]|nr:GGDEF domain-containing protein [Chloroflexota bacterium]
MVEAVGLLQGLLDSAKDPMVVGDISTGAIVLWNASARQLFGYEDLGLEGRTIADLMPRQFRTRFVHRLAEYRERNQGPWLDTPRPVATTGVRRDGRRLEVEMTLSRLDPELAPPTWLLAVVRDVSERNQRERAFELLLEAIPEGIHGVDDDGQVRFVNAAGAAILGFSREELLGKRLHSLIHHSYPDGTPFPAEDCPIVKAIEDRVAKTGQDTFWRKDGTQFPVEYTIRPMIHEGQFQGAVCTFADITERKRAEEALANQALRDPLTALPNRTLFLDRLDQAITRAQRDQTTFALLMLDLDGFKQVNDTLGHRAGDTVLSQIAIRFPSVLRASDTPARIGGDEFAVLLPTVRTSADAAIVARRLIAVMQRPFVVESSRVTVGASIGITIGSGPDDPAQLLQRADEAMYRAKRAGGGYGIWAG